MCISLPVLFVVLQQVYFHHHGIDASVFLRLDWIVDENSEDVSLPELNAPRSLSRSFAALLYCS